MKPYSRGPQCIPHRNSVELSMNESSRCKSPTGHFERRCSNRRYINPRCLIEYHIENVPGLSCSKGRSAIWPVKRGSSRNASWQASWPKWERPQSKHELDPIKQPSAAQPSEPISTNSSPTKTSKWCPAKWTTRASRESSRNTSCSNATSSNATAYATPDKSRQHACIS